MGMFDEPTQAECEAAEAHHRTWCSYGGYDDECPLDDLDPGDRYLDTDLAFIRSVPAKEQQ